MRVVVYVVRTAARECVIKGKRYVAVSFLGLRQSAKMSDRFEADPCSSLLLKERNKPTKREKSTHRGVFRHFFCKLLVLGYNIVRVKVEWIMNKRMIKVKDLSGTISDLESIHQLRISGALTVERAQALSDLVKQCPDFRDLDLSGTQLGPEVMKVLAAVLPQCPNFRGLHLWGNRIGPEGMKTLAAVLPQCPNLSELDVSDNALGPGGMKVLAGVFPKCPNLSVLKLRYNQIGSEGMKALAEVFPQCPNLRELGLGSNQIGPEGMKTLAEVLPQCLFISILGIAGFELYEARAEKITQFLSLLRVWGGPTEECFVHPQVCLQYMATDEAERAGFCSALEDDAAVSWLTENLGNLPVVTGVGREYLKAVTAFDELDLKALCLVLDPVLKRGVMDEQIAQLCDSAALRCYESEDMVVSMAYYAACDYRTLPKAGAMFGDIFLTMCPDGLLKENVNALVADEEGGADVFLSVLNDLMKGDPSLKDDVEAIMVLIAQAQIKIDMHRDLILAAFKGVRGVDLEEIQSKVMGGSIASEVNLFSEQKPTEGKGPSGFQTVQGLGGGAAAPR